MCRGCCHVLLSRASAADDCRRTLLRGARSRGSWATGEREGAASSCGRGAGRPGSVPLEGVVPVEAVGVGEGAP
eukprot:1347591-Rhodomonas_salina.1